MQHNNIYQVLSIFLSLQAPVCKGQIPANTEVHIVPTLESIQALESIQVPVNTEVHIAPTLQPIQKPAGVHIAPMVEYINGPNYTHDKIHKSLANLSKIIMHAVQNETIFTFQ